MTWLVRYVPLNGFLLALAQGWRFCGHVVEPERSGWSVLMERDE